MRATRRVGNYRIVAPVGVGASATVYRAVEDGTGYEVAIKVLAENLSLMPDARQRFIDEVELLASITSPAVARIFEVGETEDGQPYMVLELADRGDLRRRLEEVRAQGRTVEWSDVWSLARHLHEAISSLHRAGIVHRDIAPGNILIQHREELVGWSTSALLEPGERFLLADLGFAKGLEWASGLTSGGGTKGFASPEQLNDVTVVDHRSDIFSATAVLDWAVYDSPFASDLEDFLLTGLAADPEERFADIDEWYEAFSSAMEDAPIDIPRGPVGQLIAALVVVLVLALVATTLWLTGLVDSLDLGQNADGSGQESATVLAVTGGDGSGGDGSGGETETPLTAVGSPAAADGVVTIESPADNPRADDGMVEVAGTARAGPEGIGVSVIMLAVCHDATGYFWTPNEGATTDARTEVPVSVVAADSQSQQFRWDYTLDLTGSPAGLYEIEAYAVLEDGTATEQAVVYFTLE